MAGNGEDTETANHRSSHGLLRRFFGLFRSAAQEPALFEALGRLICETGGYHEARIEPLPADAAAPPAAPPAVRDDTAEVAIALVAGDEPVGLLSVVADRDALDADGLASLEALASELALGIAYIRRQRELGDILAGLRESERLFRTLAENVPGAVYLCRNDARYTMLYLSPMVETVTGHPVEAFVADEMSFVELYHPDDSERIFQEVDAALANKQPFHLVYRIVHRDGTTRWIEEFGQGVFDDSGELMMLEGTLFDISAKQRAEQEQARLHAQLLQTQKLESLGLLASGIAHDFNNLLAAILSNTHLVERGLRPDANQAHEALHAIAEITSRAAGLTRNMLAYAGRSSFEVHPIDLSAHIRTTADLLRSSVPKKVELDLDLAADLPPVDADSAQLQQMIMNLVINGAEAIGDAPGTVRVRTYATSLDGDAIAALDQSGAMAPGEYVAVRVQDSGAGIDAETRARIFDPFYTTKQTGRGLGLAAVLGVVRGHRGGLRVSSTPGEGTTFEAFLPAGTAAPMEIATPAHVDRGDGELLLVVDDEDMVRRAVCLSLEDLGYRTLDAQDGARAVELFHSHARDVDAVLLDMTMPVMDGAETMAALRAIRPDLPVVLSSGYDESDSMRDIAQDDRVRFIQKPYLPEDLLAVIRSALTAADAP